MNAPFSLLHWVEAVPESAPEVNAPEVEKQLAVLRQERAGLSGRLDAIADILAKFREASEAERLAVAAVAAIGDADVAAIRSYAAGGALGPAPRPNLAARTEANERLIEAMVHAQAVQVAGGDLEAERSEITVRLKDCAERLEALALDALSERFAAELGGLVRLGEEVQARQAQVYGCIAYLRGVGERHQMQGQNNAAIGIFKRLEQLARLPQPEFAATVGATAAAAPAWQKQFEELVRCS